MVSFESHILMLLTLMFMTEKKHRDETETIKVKVKTDVPVISLVWFLCLKTSVLIMVLRVAAFPDSPYYHPVSSLLYSCRSWIIFSHPPHDLHQLCNHHLHHRRMLIKTASSSNSFVITSNAFPSYSFTLKKKYHSHQLPLFLHPQGFTRLLSESIYSYCLHGFW